MRNEDAFAVIEHFLADQRIVCRAEDDAPGCVFWSYPLPSLSCLGWISVFRDDNELLVRATVNFGRIESPDSQAFKVLLEANSSTCGVGYATELNTLVTVGFAEKLCTLDESSLRKRLAILHQVAEASCMRFVNSQVGIEPLPKAWFEMEAKS